MSLSRDCRAAALGALIGFSACAQTDPLSVTMVNPKTNQVVRCAVRQTSTGTQPPLTAVVELCVKQLEARGFVRLDENNAAELMKNQP